MLYMTRPGVAERIEQFVNDGGCFVATYWSGLVDESDLCHLDGFPGPLRKLLGIWSEEIDALHDVDKNQINITPGNDLGLAGSYALRDLCDLIHAEGAEILATYGSDFYAGRPALTLNRFGKGQAYYIASRNEDKFHEDFYKSLVAKFGIERTLKADLPPGVTAQRRNDGDRTFVFVLNFNPHAVDVNLGGEKFKELKSGKVLTGDVEMESFGYQILEKTPS
jgi:beta-galactosidase